jgi:hypothetical protein
MRRRQVVSMIAACLASLLLLSAGASAAPKLYRARHALRYIVRHQANDGSITAFSPLGSTADAVMAMVAAKRGPRPERRALRYLKRHLSQASSIGLKAKVVMAAVAAGHDPRRFGGRNLVHKIKTSQRSNGHYGKGTSVIDQSLAMLALVSAKVLPGHRAARWLVGAQCPDGGWQYDAPYDPSTDSRHCHNRNGGDFTRSDTNTSSYAVQALHALATPVHPGTSPFAYFRWVRDPVKHGWGYDQKTTLTDANSTALVLEAYASAGRHHPHRAMRALRRLQYPRCGRHFPFAFAFSWRKSQSGRLKRTGPDVGATVGAILGLLEQPLPVPTKSVRKPIPKRPTC